MINTDDIINNYVTVIINDDNTNKTYNERLSKDKSYYHYEAFVDIDKQVEEDNVNNFPKVPDINGNPNTNHLLYAYRYTSKDAIVVMRLDTKSLTCSDGDDLDPTFFLLIPEQLDEKKLITIKEIESGINSKLNNANIFVGMTNHNKSMSSNPDELFYDTTLDEIYEMQETTTSKETARK